MKTTKLIGLSIILIVATALFTSCEKGETGDPGPQGPEGPKGSANVLFMQTDVNFSLSNISAYNERSIEVNWPAITTTVFNTSAVLVYSYSSNAWRALPCEIPTSSSNNLIMRYDVLVGKVRLWRKNSNGTIPQATINTHKFVCIPLARLAEQPNIDLSDFNQVKQAFDLED